MKNWLIIISVVVVAGILAFILMPKSDKKESNQDITAATKENPDFMNKAAEIDTTLGVITIDLYYSDAPKAVENFIRLAQKGYYNSVLFHRVVKDFVIQAGDPSGTGSGGESAFGGYFEDELSPEAPSYKEGYKKGVVAMANKGPNTNSSQFFIMLQDAPQLQHKYTIFGKVVSGQDVVDKIGQVKVDSSTDKPLESVLIKEVKIVNKK